MKTVKTHILESSLTRNLLHADYIDAFRCSADGKTDFSADDLQVAFWTGMPGWVNVMMKFRDLLVKPFGLKGGAGGSAGELEQCIRSGGILGLFSVAAKTEHETTVSLADMHLNAWMSVMIQGSDVYAITLVKYNNRLGRVYFFIIGPFHKIIVRSALASAVRRLSYTQEKS